MIFNLSFGGQNKSIRNGTTWHNCHRIADHSCKRYLPSFPNRLLLKIRQTCSGQPINTVQLCLNQQPFLCGKNINDSIIFKMDYWKPMGLSAFDFKRPSLAVWKYMEFWYWKI
jgi:hypothetical protein